MLGKLLIGHFHFPRRTNNSVNADVRQNVAISFVLVKVLIKTEYVLALIKHLLLLRNSVLQQEVMIKNLRVKLLFSSMLLLRDRSFLHPPPPPHTHTPEE